MSLIAFNKKLKNQCPEGWRTVPLGDLVIRSQYGLSEPTSSDGNVRMLGMSCLKDGKIIYDELGLIKLSEKGFNKYRIKSGDILINRTNSIELVGKASLVEEDKEIVFASYVVRFVVDREQVDPSYLVYYLNTPNSQTRLTALATRGVSQANINPETLKKLFLLHLPPLEEQIKITAVLKSWDEAIGLTEKLIVKKKRYFKSIQNQLINGLKYSNGECWQEVRLEEIVTKQKGRSVNLNQIGIGFPYIGSESFTGNYWQYTTSDGVLCNKNDILLLWDGENAGKVTTGLTGVVGSTVSVLRLRKCVSSEFIYEHLDANNNKIRAIREGSGIPHIPGDFLSWYRIKLPPLQFQRKIGATLYCLRREINFLEKKFASFKTQKNGLMQKIFNGG